MKPGLLTRFVICATLMLPVVFPFGLTDGGFAAERALDSRHTSTESAASEQWGEPVTPDGLRTRFSIYRQKFVYGSTPFRVTDMRAGEAYAGKEDYEIRGLTVYRAHDGEALLDNQPVVFFVHGGAWVDGYEDWYDFVSLSFTGEKGWVTVVVDYRLTSRETYLADESCPDRAACSAPENVEARTKAAWYPDNADDVAEAFSWVAQNIGSDGGDPSLIFVLGHSAGGHLASLLAVHPAYASLRPFIKAVISMGGAYALNDLDMSYMGGYLDQTFQGGHLDNREELNEASPATYAASPEIPPFYLLYCEDELPSFDLQAEMFREALEQAGHDPRLDYLSGYEHTTAIIALADIAAAPTVLVTDYISSLVNDSHSGWWYIPEENGAGLSVEIYPGGQVTLAWHAYDDAGRPIWLTSEGSMSLSTLYRGTLYSWSGPAPESSPDTPRRSAVGDVEIRFGGPGLASLSWNYDGTMMEKDMDKFMDDVAPGAEHPLAIRGWWYDPHYEGMGLYLEAQGGIIFLAWYLYREDDSPRWLSGGGAFPDESVSWSGTLSEWQNGSCVRCDYTEPVETPGPHVSLTFLSDTRATFTFSGITLNLTRMGVAE